MVVVTGGSGVLGGAIASGLAGAGARVAILARGPERVAAAAAAVAAVGGEALELVADVLRRDELEAARARLLDRWGRLDILVNAAGGNVAAATASGDTPFSELPEPALRQVFDLNLMGTLIPCQVFLPALADGGCVVNVSSMAAQRPLTNVVGYAAAKAAVENFTRWLAVDVTRRRGPGIRVNAVAPGFFVADQNRALLESADGTPTARGRAVLEHTPAGRFGLPDDLVGPVIWLCGDGARFVNGAVLNVDGGFSAFAGV